MEQACAERGVIVRVGAAPEIACEEASFVSAPPGLRTALASESVEDVTHALAEVHSRSMWVALVPAARGSSIGARLARAEPVEGFRTLALAKGVMLVKPFALPTFTEREAWALAEVARKVLAGTSPPALEQFPAPLRAQRPVEAMVLLRDHGSPIFWRSARGGSVASSLLLALSASRARWADRSSVVRGDLSERIPRLDVEVWLLAEDGTYSDRDPGLIDVTVGDHHGVGYESNASWVYELPERIGSLRGMGAFNRLFHENNLDEHALESPNLRLYRLRAVRIARSVAEPIRIGLPPPPDLVQAGDSL
jgi:hypothetical protein